MLRKKERSKGITLIALVITIVILLILAGVAIAALTGNNRNTKKSRTSQGKICNIAKNRRSKSSINGSNYRKQWRK